MGDPGFEDDSIPIHPHREYNPKFTPHVLRICKVMNKKVRLKLNGHEMYLVNHLHFLCRNLVEEVVMYCL